MKCFEIRGTNILKKCRVRWWYPVFITLIQSVEFQWKQVIKGLLPSWWKLGSHKIAEFPSSLPNPALRPAFHWPAALSMLGSCLFSVQTGFTQSKVRTVWEALWFCRLVIFLHGSPRHKHFCQDQLDPTGNLLACTSSKWPSRYQFCILGLDFFACTQIFMANWFKTFCNRVAVAPWYC